MKNLIFCEVLFKSFLIRNLYTFYFRQCFAVLFKFSSIFVILFFSLLKTQVYKNENARREFQSVFTSLIDTFPNCKNVQSAIG